MTPEDSEMIANICYAQIRFDRYSTYSAFGVFPFSARCCLARSEIIVAPLFVLLRHTG